jgi:microcystin degradation protein MlrC
LRDQLRPDWPDIPGALDRVEKAKAFPLVLADFADNAGGGAPSDSTFVLQEVLARGMTDIALGIYWDPVLVRMCKEVGVGGAMQVRLGGKVGPMSGDPVDLEVTIRAIRDNMSQMMGDTAMPMGTGVWLEANGLHLVINDLRSQTFHPSAFTDLGIDLAAMKAVVVKSSQHFYAGFAPIASEVIHIAGPGAITPDFTIIPYTKRDDNYWPKTEDPFA